MKEGNLPEIKQRILYLLPEKDGEAIFDAVLDLDMYCLSLNAIPENVFCFLEATLSSGLAHRSLHSSRLFSFFDSNWKKLSAEQKDRLLQLISKNYSRYQDWMAWFVVSEILGECFSNRRSLAITKHLKRTCNKKGPRAMIPHAFEHHITDSGSLLIKKMALRELKEMKKSKLNRVRSEAEISLKRVKVRYLSRFSFRPLFPRKAP